MFVSRRLTRLALARSLPKCQHNTRIIPPRPSATAAYSSTRTLLVPVASGSVSKADAIVEKLRTTPHILEVHGFYKALVDELRAEKRDKNIARTSPLSEEDLNDLIDVLAVSGRPADLQRIHDVFSDMHSLFGVRPSVHHHTNIIRRLIERGNAHIVENWLLKMPSSCGHFIPTHEQYHMFLEAFLNVEPFGFVRNAILSMRKTGCLPNSETFLILFQARWKAAEIENKIPHVIVFSRLLDEIKMEGAIYDPELLNLLYDNYESRGYPVYAEEIRAAYLGIFSDSSSSRRNQHRLWRAKLAAVAQTRGLKSAVDLYLNEAEKDGYDASSAALSILRHSRHIDDLRFVEEKLSIQADSSHWAMLIANSARADNPAEALTLYEGSREAGIVPDARLVAPLIRILCRSTSKIPNDDNLVQALAIYDDLVAVAPAKEKQKLDKTQHSQGPDSDIYQNLLRGVATSSDIGKYYGTAMSLLEDMKSRGVTVEDTFTASSLIVVLMRRSTDATEALDVYRGLRDSLDEKGCAVVLNCFCKLAFDGNLPIPSLTNYFEIVNDMRRRGLKITGEVYTILLHHIAKLGTEVRKQKSDSDPDTLERLINTTRRTHDLITLDASISPDAYLWNQLMDAYQRLGCFADACRVWDTMYVCGRYNQASVSIILDACGYAGAWPMAKRICGRLFQDRFVFNIRNWNSWLECLCRLGRINDAVKVACVDMGKVPDSIPPDVESIKILMKFARNTTQHVEVRSRIQRHLPELWKTLPKEYW
ncbi:pentatricopeptide repeat-containing protein [Crucibulum laeve]|uniref:Pentatricopeptide repeat-containing protein n=1 Tax=Crucibulum laeve TaxID=68775 RepID=A0A5C3LW71_9AGAR|nr:pentatricopeptide repeat-containing protein [Crucibulum laeve]